MSTDDWEPGDPVYRDRSEQLTCRACGTEVAWQPDMPDVGMPCPECADDTLAAVDWPSPTVLG